MRSQVMDHCQMMSTWRLPHALRANIIVVALVCQIHTTWRLLMRRAWTRGCPICRIRHGAGCGGVIYSYFFSEKLFSFKTSVRRLSWVTNAAITPGGPGVTRSQGLIASPQAAASHLRCADRATA